MSWDPDRYQRFQAERAQPFLDLLARIPRRAYARIADLGCGTGTHTATLAKQHPEAQVTGVDAAPEMLERAPRDAPNLTFVHADIATWTPPEPFDLVVSNAALHWLPDHHRLVPHLADTLLTPDGTLAFQVPANHEAPSHLAVADVAADPRWADRVEPCLAPGSVLPLADYRRLLDAPRRTVEAWDTVYEHRLPGLDALVDWLAGTTLHAALGRLDPDERDDLTDQLKRRLAAAYGDADVVRFPFRRRFVIATPNQTG